MRFSLRLYVFVLGAVLALSSVSLSAQDGTLPIAGSTDWYTSVGGIVAATAVIVQVLKKSLSRVVFLQDVPLWLYSVVVASALTILAENVLQTIHGGLMADLNQAVLMAAAASGLFSWFDKPKASPLSTK